MSGKGRAGAEPREEASERCPGFLERTEGGQLSL